MSRLTKTVSRPRGTTSRTRISTGTSFLGKARPGERVWRVWKNVRKAGDAAGKTNEECGRWVALFPFDPAFTGRTVHGEDTAETIEAGAHGVIAIYRTVLGERSSRSSRSERSLLSAKTFL